MADGGQTLGVRFDAKPWPPSGQRILNLSALAATMRRTVSSLISFDRGGIWRVGPLQAHLNVVTKRFFLILGALLAFGDVGSIALGVSESSGVTATAILTALVSAFSLTAEFKPVPEKTRSNRTDLVTSTVSVVEAMASALPIDPHRS